MLIYLHSLAEESPATDVEFTALLESHRLRCLAPFGGWSWWANRICPEFDSTTSPECFLTERVVPWVESEWGIGPSGIGIVGVEMGGQGALRIAFRHPDRFPVAASISGAFDCHDWYGRGTPLDTIYSSRESCRLDSAILQLGTKWPRHLWFCCDPSDASCYRGNDRLREKLCAVGVPHHADLDTRGLPGGRYRIQMCEPMLTFVASALDAEAKRLM